MPEEPSETLRQVLKLIDEHCGRCREYDLEFRCDDCPLSKAIALLEAVVGRLGERGPRQ